jgi:hypothetical protein
LAAGTVAETALWREEDEEEEEEEEENESSICLFMRSAEGRHERDWAPPDMENLRRVRWRVFSPSSPSSPPWLPLDAAAAAVAAAAVPSAAVAVADVGNSTHVPVRDFLQLRK